MIIGWTVRLFDLFLKLMLSERYKSRIRRRLLDELEMYTSVATDDSVSTSAPQITSAALLKQSIDRLQRLTLLIQVNHQRVSASISHISIMNAVLAFTYVYLFAGNPKSRFIISLEIPAYLLITMALLRCLRDFGLDRDYGGDRELYSTSLLDELTYRYAVLRSCNAGLILGTATIAMLFSFHFLPSSITGSVIKQVDQLYSRLIG